MIISNPDLVLKLFYLSLLNDLLLFMDTFFVVCFIYNGLAHNQKECPKTGSFLNIISSSLSHIIAYWNNFICLISMDKKGSI